MHVAVNLNVLEDFAAVGLQGAAVVVETRPGNPTDHEVGDPRGEDTEEIGILTVDSPARHQVISLIELRE